MVYNIGGLVSTIGAGINNEQFIKAIGNPMFPLISISIIFILILSLLTYKSQYVGKWKWLSVMAIITLSSVASILFLNKYMAKKVSGSFVGGSTHQLPNPSYFTDDIKASPPQQTINIDPPSPSFDELFADLG